MNQPKSWLSFVFDIGMNHYFLSKSAELCYLGVNSGYFTKLNMDYTDKEFLVLVRINNFKTSNYSTFIFGFRNHDKLFDTIHSFKLNHYCQMTALFWFSRQTKITIFIVV